MCSAIHVLNNYHNNNSNKNATRVFKKKVRVEGVYTRIEHRKKVLCTRQKSLFRKVETKKKKKKKAHTKKNLHELIVCVPLPLSFHFRHKMPSILLFLFVVVAAVSSSIFLLLLLLFFLVCMICIYLDYLTTCVHYNSLHRFFVSCPPCCVRVLELVMTNFIEK